jgi:deoxycytidylate deaminase
MTPFDKRIINVAAGLAALSTHPKAHIGAVLVVGRDIISVGVNGRKSHPLQKYYNKFRFLDDNAHHLMHAELEALVRGRAMIRSNATMYIYRLLRTGEQGMCRPCGGCMRALSDYKIGNIVYSTNNGFAHEELKNVLHTARI